MELSLESKKVRRALRLLANQYAPAHEWQEQPLSVLSVLHTHGLVRRVPYTARWGGKEHNCWETRLTEAGKQLAAKLGYL